MNAQAALKDCGIPAYLGAWRESSAYPSPPDQYIVHTAMTVPDEYWDDKIVAHRIHAYVNLWSKGNPGESKAAVRAAMRAGGWEMSDEREEYDDDSGLFLIAWTWIAREVA